MRCYSGPPNSHFCFSLMSIKTMRSYLHISSFTSHFCELRSGRHYNCQCVSLDIVFSSQHRQLFGLRSSSIRCSFFVGYFTLQGQCRRFVVEGLELTRRMQSPTSHHWVGIRFNIWETYVNKKDCVYLKQNHSADPAARFWSPNRAFNQQCKSSARRTDFPRSKFARQHAGTFPRPRGQRCQR